MNTSRNKGWLIDRCPDVNSVVLVLFAVNSVEVKLQNEQVFIPVQDHQLQNDEEDDDVDRDPNFGRSVLSHYKTGDTVTRFSGQFDTPSSSTLPSSRSSSTYTRSSRTSVTEEPKTSTTTTTFSKDGNTTETTTITTTQSVRSPTKTDTFSERVLSSSNRYSSYSPNRTTKVTETTLSSNDAEDKLFDTLIPSSIRDDYSPTDSRKSYSTTETVTVRSSSDLNAENNLYDTLIPKAIKDGETESKTTVTSSEWRKSSTNGDITKTTRTSRTSSSAEDGLYDTLLPMGIKSPTRDESPTLSSPSYSSRVSRYSSSYGDESPTTRTTSYTISSKPSEDYSSKTYSYSSRSDDNMGDSVYSRSSSTKSVYAPPERTVLERDLCSSCRKPFTGDAKMVLDDMRINCHANCFKCEVCNCSLGHLKAGDIMWIYKRMVHCENCFEVTRDKWRR
ncbi:sciellin isoform X2 [Solea senegalensis]|uniref:Sciellin isoform X2 n=1 Tax=Solea senegalensis TaxID=28829 RepID=A0AAV6RE84_SOLSE|nr:sciellin isoform X2 [Solea senegalensis]